MPPHEAPRSLLDLYARARASRPTRAWYSIVQSDVVRARAGESSQPLRGRDAEFARLVDRLGELVAGVSTVVLIEGDAGMGKSRDADCAQLRAVHVAPCR